MDMHKPKESTPPLGRQQFSRYVGFWHILYIGGIATTVLTSWLGNKVLSWQQEVVLGILALLQSALYLSTFVWAPWPLATWRQLLYFAGSMVLWFPAWRMEPRFEWLIGAICGQMFIVLSPRVAIPAALMTLGTWIFYHSAWESLYHLSPLSWFSMTAQILAWAVAAAYIHQLGQTSSERGRLVAELQVAKAKLEAARQRDAELATLRERERIAREFHDVLGHTLVTLNVQLEAAQRLYPLDATRAAVVMEEMKGLVRASMAELRCTLSDLRAPGLGDRALPQALSLLSAETAKRTGMDVVCAVVGSLDQMPGAVADALWRISQEALANIDRHANASRVNIELILAPRAVMLRVTDDGVGLRPDAENLPGHYGLRGMRERADGLGGAFCLESAQGGGTRLEVRLPIIGHS